jgi:hypothetical protein
VLCVCVCAASTRAGGEEEDEEVRAAGGDGGVQRGACVERVLRVGPHAAASELEHGRLVPRLARPQQLRGLFGRGLPLLLPHLFLYCRCRC